MYRDVLTKLTTHQELTEAEIFELIRAVNHGEVSDVQIAGFQVESEAFVLAEELSARYMGMAFGDSMAKMDKPERKLLFTKETLFNSIEAYDGTVDEYIEKWKCNGVISRSSFGKIVTAANGIFCIAGRFTTTYSMMYRAATHEVF